MFSDKIDYFLNRDTSVIQWFVFIEPRARQSGCCENEKLLSGASALFSESQSDGQLLIIAELKILRLTRLWLAIFQILPAAAYSDWLLGSCSEQLADESWVMIPLLLGSERSCSSSWHCCCWCWTTNRQQTKTIWLKFCSKFLTFLLVKPQKDS